jgi:hypothetical protein
VERQDSIMLGRDEEIFDGRSNSECITRPFFPAELVALATVPRPLNTPTTGKGAAM